MNENNMNENNMNSQLLEAIKSKNYENYASIFYSDEDNIDWSCFILKEIKSLANDNNSYAQHVLGWAYGDGSGVEQDYEKAFEWYTKSALQNNSCAQHALGYMYDEGLGVEQDYKKAFEWYTKSAPQNNAHAQHNLGYMYDNGLGVEQDYKKAVEWYTKASLQNHPSSQVNLGLMYHCGLGVDKDYKKAIELYTKSALQNNKDAQNDLKEIFNNEKAMYHLLSIFGENKELKEKNKVLEKEILELKLRPPSEGGTLYQEHKTQFDENIKDL